MSLDVYLTADFPALAPQGGSGIFVRRNGQTVEMTRDEWDRAFPGQEPVVVTAEADVDTGVYSANITHNLGKMADEAGIYTHLWHPENLPYQPVKAHELVAPIEAGLALMKAEPERFKKHNSPNGWGLYEHFIPWIERYLAALKESPEADVHTTT